LDTEAGQAHPIEHRAHLDNLALAFEEERNVRGSQTGQPGIPEVASLPSVDDGDASGSQQIDEVVVGEPKF
jgi:hypothetical protein